MGRSRAANRLDRAGDAGIRSRCWHLRALVRRRRLQHLLERGRPPCDAGPRRTAGDHLRFAAGRAEAHAHLSRTPGRDPVAGRDPAQPRRREGRPGRALYADGAGGGNRNARLRAHRRGALSGVRRVCGERARDPHRRRQAEGDPVGELRARARPHRQVQAAARRGDPTLDAQARCLPHPAAPAGGGGAGCRPRS